MDILTLLGDARSAGLTVTSDGKALRIRGPHSAQHLARQLGDRKPEVMTALLGVYTSMVYETSEKQPESGGSVDGRRVDASRADPWEAPGYFPNQPIVRNGVRHKLETCTGCRSWRHVWGGSYCAACWPPTDSLAVANGREEIPTKSEETMLDNWASTG
jgi:hypothetical protein